MLYLRSVELELKIKECLFFLLITDGGDPELYWIIEAIAEGEAAATKPANNIQNCQVPVRT